MKNTDIKNFGFATLRYIQGRHNYFLLETKQKDGILYSSTFSQYFSVRPTERQIRKTLQNISKKTTILQ